ncbi:MAG: hypothetical protein V1899_06090 [Planctomycetota bacterium]
MTSESKSFVEKLAYMMRVVLIGMIIVVAVLMITSSHQSANPFSISRANAEGICATPGYLVLTASIGGANKFFIVDTNKQVICVYGMVGDKLRLVSARKFDFDSDIFDGSLQIGAMRGIEGGNGVTRAEAKIYSEGLKKAWDALPKK